MSALQRFRTLTATLGMLALAACSSSSQVGQTTTAPMANMSTTPPSPDPRVGLKAGVNDAGEAIWNMELVSNTPSAPQFVGATNSDLAFSGKYAIQGNYNGFMVWDISNPANPVLTTSYFCPASQSDVSVHKNLLFVSGEGLSGRLDCGAQGVQEAVSHDRLRGIRIFDISDITAPKYVANVQTCRGSHTHTVLADPDDTQNVYVYISGSAGVRPDDELPGCVDALPEDDPNSARFRIEVIKVPLADPTKAAIVSSPRIFNDLEAPPVHGPAPEDAARAKAAADQARARGAFVAEAQGQVFVLPDGFTRPMLDSIVKARGGSGAPTAADSAALRAGIPALIARMMGGGGDGARRGPDQCHDITVYPAIGLAGGACGGYGLLLDISDPVNPRRVAAVSDSNFSYWHSATFNNDGSKILFSDEWGGGGQPKCRATDRPEWGADAIFTLRNNTLDFKSYYKLPAAQTEFENCVAHNGSLLPIPGRDIMVQAWYQGGISVFDWTDAENPVEIAFHDRGPLEAGQMSSAGSWSVYWYNGSIVSSEIARGLDIFKLKPSGFLSQNEIDAANTVVLEELNAQGQPQYVWPASFSLARAYLDQLERDGGLSMERINAARNELRNAESASGNARNQALRALATRLASEVPGAADQEKVRLLAGAVTALAE